jgi:methanogenic corrinoid protein MtbC1
MVDITEPGGTPVDMTLEKNGFPIKDLGNDIGEKDFLRSH